jgi:AraC family cel operon transcriptional repressor
VEIPVLTWQRCDAHLPWIRASRHRLRAHEQVSWHAHAYHEWTWVARGQLSHVCNARGEEMLRSGDLRVMPPGQAHQMSAASETVLTSVSIEPQLYRSWSQTHLGQSWWPWHDDVGAFHLHPHALGGLEAALDDLPGVGQQSLDAGWFLLALCRAVRPRLAAAASVPASASDPAEDQCPPWLRQAIEEFTRNGVLDGGGRALVKLTGRHPTYVARLVRRHHGCSLRDLVNTLRIQAAAHTLRHTDKSITEIAMEVGLPNLGHFYRLFKAAFAMTPRAYRQATLVPMGFFKRLRPD